MGRPGGPRAPGSFQSPRGCGSERVTLPRDILYICVYSTYFIKQVRDNCASVDGVCEEAWRARGRGVEQRWSVYCRWREPVMGGLHVLPSIGAGQAWGRCGAPTGVEGSRHKCGKEGVGVEGEGGIPRKL